jgi:hypothetical protein
LAVISAQLLTKSSPKIFAGSHGFVSRNSPRRGWLPKLSIFTRRDDGCGTPIGNYIMASARVISLISSDLSNFLAGRDLVPAGRTA